MWRGVISLADTALPPSTAKQILKLWLVSHAVLVQVTVMLARVATRPGLRISMVPKFIGSISATHSALAGCIDRSIRKQAAEIASCDVARIDFFIVYILFRLNLGGRLKMTVSGISK